MGSVVSDKAIDSERSAAIEGDQACTRSCDDMMVGDDLAIGRDDEATTFGCGFATVVAHIYQNYGAS